MEESHLYCILCGVDKYSMQDPVNRGRRVQWSRYAWYRIGAVECSRPVGDLSAVCALTKIDLRVPMSMTNQELKEDTHLCETFNMLRRMYISVASPAVP